MMDEIRIDDLEVYAYHGVFPEETEKGQLFYVKAVLATDTRAAGREDRLELSTHYGEVCHFITRWMQEHTYKLIEAVAENVAREVLLAFPGIRSVALEIRKPQAPIGLPFDSVSVRIQRGWHRVFLGIGSNMGDREQYIREGIHSLEELRDIRLKKVSELIRTEPYGGVEQEDFLNGAVEIETLLTPGELLRELHRIEGEAHRERKVRWGPRTLDLDILFYDQMVYEDDELVIPHADMQNRYFVLKPMCELAPNFRHPLLGRTLGELLSEVTSRSAG